MKGMGIIFIVMILSFVIAGLWDSIPIVKSVVHTILDPTAGILLTWNPTLGMLIITALITLLTTFLQKFLTDQETLKTIKQEQKIVQQEMKLARESPEKSMALSKKSLELTMQAMPLTMRPLMYTIIPFVLFFRWFNDYFTINSVKILGLMSWFWAYLLFSIIFSTIFRKILKVH